MRVLPPASLASIVATVLAAGACGPKVTPPVDPDDEEWTAVDERMSREELEAELRATALEAYKALSGGYEEAYLDGLTRDARLILIDVEPDDVAIGYDPTACQLRRQFPDKQMELVSKALEVHVSEDATVGWIYDELSYRVIHAGRRAIIPLRVTGVYQRDEGRWIKMMEHVSYGIPDDEALAMARDPALQLPPPKVFTDDTPPGPEAQTVREILLDLIEDDHFSRNKHIATDDRALVVGSDPDREIRGAAVADLATVRALYGFDYKVTPEALRIRVARAKKAAWAAANLYLTDGQGKRLLGLRATWVLEKADGPWRVVQTHVSLPVPRDVLALRVFGEAIASGSDGGPGDVAVR
jgi:ketosteroid isomerase-like protein